MRSSKKFVPSPSTKKEALINVRLTTVTSDNLFIGLYSKHVFFPLTDTFQRGCLGRVQIKQLYNGAYYSGGTTGGAKGWRHVYFFLC